MMKLIVSSKQSKGSMPLGLMSIASTNVEARATRFWKETHSKGQVTVQSAIPVSSAVRKQMAEQIALFALYAQPLFMICDKQVKRKPALQAPNARNSLDLLTMLLISHRESGMMLAEIGSNTAVLKALYTDFDQSWDVKKQPTSALAFQGTHPIAVVQSLIGLGSAGSKTAQMLSKFLSGIHELMDESIFGLSGFDDKARAYSIKADQDELNSKALKIAASLSLLTSINASFAEQKMHHLDEGDYETSFWSVISTKFSQQTTATNKTLVKSLLLKALHIAFGDLSLPSQTVITGYGVMGYVVKKNKNPVATSETQMCAYWYNSTYIYGIGGPYIRGTLTMKKKMSNWGDKSLYDKITQTTDPSLLNLLNSLGQGEVFTDNRQIVKWLVEGENETLRRLAESGRSLPIPDPVYADLKSSLLEDLSGDIFSVVRKKEIVARVLARQKNAYDDNQLTFFSSTDLSMVRVLFARAAAYDVILSAPMFTDLEANVRSEGENSVTIKGVHLTKLDADFITSMDSKSSEKEVDFKRKISNKTKNRLFP